VKSDRGGEYYGRYDETRKHSRPFAKLFHKRDICVKYIFPGTPQQK